MKKETVGIRITVFSRDMFSDPIIGEAILMARTFTLQYGSDSVLFEYHRSTVSRLDVRRLHNHPG